MRRVLYDCSQFQWIDLANPSKEELDQIQHEFLLHPAFVVDCLDPAHLPKYETTGNITFFILRIFDIDSDATADTLQSLTRKISVFIGPKFIITVHRLDPGFFAELIDRCFLEIKHQMGQSENHMVSIPHALVKFLNRALRTYHIPLENAEDDLEHIENMFFQDQSNVTTFQDLHIMRRRLSLMKRVLLHSQDVVQRLSPASQSSSPVFQDLRENVQSLIFLTDELHEDTTNFLGLQISLSSQKTNEVMRVLTVFSVFFMPLTFIVGVYGMNFEMMPELQWEYGYLIVWGIMIAIVVSIAIWFKRKKWI